MKPFSRVVSITCIALRSGYFVRSYPAIYRDNDSFVKTQGEGRGGETVAQTSPVSCSEIKNKKYENQFLFVGKSLNTQAFRELGAGDRQTNE